MRALLLLLISHAILAACSSRSAATEPRAPGAMPPHARRTEPPPSIGGALQVGARAPQLELPATTGGTFSLARALERGPLVLVFYRGSW